MLTFSWTGKRKKKTDSTDGRRTISLSNSKQKFLDIDCSESSASRSTTSSDSIHFGQTTPFTSTVATNFKEAEYSGRLLLHGLRLTEFPNDAFSNHDLLDVVLIDLSDNRLSTLPAEFSLFDCLISCIANSNRFQSIPSCINSVENLTYLDFSFNEISHLPDGIFDLPLTTLLLAGNRISCIPESIRRLSPTLAYLDLSRNQLKVLQPHLKYLKSLKVFKLARNMIEDIPSEFCTCLELRTLDLSQNNLSFLPNDFSHMTSLRNLNLSGNPLRSPPIEIVNKGIMHIFKWLDGHLSNPAINIGNNKNTHSLSERNCKNESIDNRLTQHQLDSTRKLENGNHTFRSKELYEPKVAQPIATTPPVKPQNVQTLQNKVSSVQSYATTDHSRFSSPDEQNNNKTSVGNHSSPGMTKKPISKVAPMIKGTSRQSPVTTNGNVPPKTTTIRRAITTTTMTKQAAKSEIPQKTESKIGKSRLVGSTASTRKSEEPIINRTNRPSTNATASTTNLSKPSARVPINDVEKARKLMKEKLGPTFAVSKGDIGFSTQLSDGVELCKFVNKLQADSIKIVTESSAMTKSKLNAERFVQYCKKIGVPENTTCSPLDIISKRNPQKIARTILCIAKLQEASPKT